MRKIIPNESVTSPALDTAEISLRALIDVDKLQSIMDDFYVLTQLVTATLDLEGNVIEATGWQDICTKFHRKNPVTARKCKESDTLFPKGLKLGEYYNYKCKNGLREVVTPLYIEGKHLGNIYTGQFFYEDEQIDNAFFIEQAALYGFDQTAYLQALSRVPRLNRKTIQHLMHFLVKFTAYVSEISLANFKLQQEIIERKQAQEALVISETQLRTLIRTIPDLVWLKDPEGCFLTCNSRFEDFIGAIEKDIVGKTDYDFVDKKQADFFRKHDLVAIEKGRSIKNEETVAFAADGHQEILETIKTPIFHDDGRLIGVLGIARDITERKQAEEALRLHERLFEKMGQIAHVGGWEFDPATGEGIWTPEVARIHDLDPSDGTHVQRGLSFYKGKHREKIEKAVKEISEIGTPFDLELEMVSAKGISKWVHSQGQAIMSGGKVVKVYGSFQDISARKQAEILAREQDERMRLALQAAQMGTWEWDLADNRIHWSPETFKVFGASRADFGGTYEAYLGFVDPGMRDMVDEKVRFFLENPHAGKKILYEHKVVRADGTPGWVEVHGKMFLDDRGLPVRMSGICQDITQRKQDEEELRNFRNHLEELVGKRTAELKVANEELAAFSYSVSHDLRAPLRAINGYTRILMEDYAAQLDDEGRRVCSIIGNSAKNMGQLIDDLLAFSQMGRAAIRPTIVNMNNLAKSIFFDLTTEEERKRIDVQIAELPDAFVDASLVRHVWANLLSNAIKFSAKRERTIINITGKHEDEQVIYRVEDNGAGFDMQYADKLFGVFQRLHSAKDFSGTGVGLAIVHRVVSRHGGYVHAMGTIDQGAVFEFGLPEKTCNGTASYCPEEGDYSGAATMHD